MNNPLPSKRCTMVRNQYDEKMIKIIFPYEISTLDKVRSLSGRKYHTDLKVWTAPVYLESLLKLQEWGFNLDDKLIAMRDKLQKKGEAIRHQSIPGLKGTPLPYQYDGVAFIEHNDGRCLLADEMGLGKTVQALAWYQMHRELVPAIIVVPASLKLNWKIECEAWLPDANVEILNGEKPYTPTGDILIINYDILPAWVKELNGLNPQLLITDECHYYKSNAAQRTRAIKKIGKGVPHVIAISGTPIVNRPVEIYNAIRLVNPQLFPNFMDFTREYCAAKHNGYGWDYSGASNTQKLHKILTDTIMIRRLKKDVLQELPDKRYSYIPFNLKNAEEYNSAQNDFLDYLLDSKGERAARKAANAEVITQIETLKQLAVKGVLKDALDWVEDFIESDKLVLFCTHKFVVEELMKRFKGKAVKIDGTTSQEERQRSVDIFQYNPNCKLFVGNIKAAGVGITLTASSNVAFLELPWTPGELRQAIDRVHRIGQKSSVNVYYLFAINTIMNKTARIIDNKQRVLDAVLDGKETDTFDLLLEIIKDFEQELNQRKLYGKRM